MNRRRELLKWSAPLVVATSLPAHSQTSPVDPVDPVEPVDPVVPVDPPPMQFMCSVEYISFETDPTIPGYRLLFNVTNDDVPRGLRYRTTNLEFGIHSPVGQAAIPLNISSPEPLTILVTSENRNIPTFIEIWVMPECEGFEDMEFLLPEF